MGLACAVAAVVSGVMLWLCYFPVAFGWLGWIVLVPWLMLVRAELPKRRRYLFAGMAAMIFFVPVLAWMRNGDSGMFYLWFLLAIYMSSYFVVALWLIRRLDRRTLLPMTISVPLVWTALEFARSKLMGGFSWYLLGHTQQNLLPAIQIVDVAGVWAVSFVVAAVNGLLTEIASRSPAVRSWFAIATTDRQPALRRQGLFVAILLLVMFAYGGWRLSQNDFAAGPRVALLQTCVGQTERNKADVTATGDALAQQEIAQQNVALAKEAIRHVPPPDLVILPETAFPGDWFEVAAAAPAGPTRSDWVDRRDRWCEYARQYVRLVGIPVLMGLNTQTLDEKGKIERYNSALLITPGHDTVSRYDKIHLLPFGEYLPFKDSLSFVKWFSPYGDFDYSITPGTQQTRIPIDVRGHTYQLGVVICYEVADATLTRGLVRAGREPSSDIIVNITNDGWYMGTAEHAEHLAISRFAAVECRRPLLRAVNGGISAVIDGNGRVVALPKPTWDESHSLTGVVKAVVPLDARTSLYARLGDWLPWTCWGLLLVGCAWRPKASPNP